jgi:hypothetical protein
MLQFMFDGVQAFNQIGLFIGALFCLGLAGLLLGNALHWRLHGLRVTGTVIGVLDRGGTFTPVYRYVGPDGQTHKVKSDTSSGAVAGKETGRGVPLLIAPHDPARATEANSHVFEIIGVLLLLPGLWLGYVALFRYPVTAATWVMAAVTLIYLAERAHRVFIPKSQRGSVAEWRAQRGLDAPIDLAAVKPIEQVATVTAAQQSLHGQIQSNRKMAPFVGAFAMALLFVAAMQTRDIARLEARGLRAAGEVVRLKGEWSSGRNSTYTYHAIVRFRVGETTGVEFKDSVGSSPASYRPGDKVTVLYLADDLGSAIVDRGVVLNWAIPALLFIGAGLLAWLTAAMARRNATAPVPAGGFASAPRA